MDNVYINLATKTSKSISQSTEEIIAIMDQIMASGERHE